MGIENESLDFFEEASSLIYKWLSEEERNQLLMELYGENVRNIAELSPELQFFRLLHFIEVRFIRVEKWGSRIAELLENIRSKNSDLFIEDLVFKDANNDDVSLLELREKQNPKLLLSISYSNLACRKNTNVLSLLHEKGGENGNKKAETSVCQQLLKFFRWTQTFGCKLSG